MRIGMGYDVHQLVEGEELILGGVSIPFTRGLQGHSDADVLVHAVMDALLGALALGDIGKHFPAGDPQYAGISSLYLLGQVQEKVHQAGWHLGNLDSVIVAQEPRLAPVILEIRENLARVLQVPITAISVKATTTEGLGFAGRGEGIAAYAIVCLEPIPVPD